MLIGKWWVIFVFLFLRFFLMFYSESSALFLGRWFR